MSVIKKKKEKCKTEKKVKKTNEVLFFEQAKEKYGDKYDYSNVEYVNAQTKINIICPKHGEFRKTPNKFLQGQECKLCKEERRIEALKERKNIFIEKARHIHGDKYDYSEVVYLGSPKHVKIICHCKDKNGNEHGPFSQIAESHLQGHGCPICAQEIRTEKSKKNTQQFIAEAKEKFPDYDYSKTLYVDQNTPVIITCHKKFKNGKEHGDFPAVPNKLLSRGAHCPHCTQKSSYPEKELYSYVVEKIGAENIKFHERKILKGDEIDIYIPSKKLGIEFNGIYWHSECSEYISKKTHLNKTERCEKQGVQLIQIFSDEYSEKKDIVFKKINQFLNINTHKYIVLSNCCEIKEITKKEAKFFLNKYHINGYAKSSFYIGAWHYGKLFSVMSFVKNRNDEYTLNRFAIDDEYKCKNIEGKLFKYFIEKYSPTIVKTFTDRRYCNINDDTFTSIGFTFDGYTKPDYTFMYKTNSSLGRFNKNYVSKEIINKKPSSQLIKASIETAHDLGYYRVWDCGQIRYLWKNNNKK